MDGLYVDLALDAVLEEDFGSAVEAKGLAGRMIRLQAMESSRRCEYTLRLECLWASNAGSGR